MKCLKTLKGVVMESRYPDDLAAEMVESGAYVYCSKEEWKEKVRDPKIEAAKNAAKKDVTEKKGKKKSRKSRNKH